ncbi:MAG TPA: 30S ribosomal protein S21 [Gemmatimonadaceae bacterium]|nr:30S ribosomal protein S21 [Gemmatimonadaceae bacterium]
MIEVTVEVSESLERALKRFKKQVQRSGLLRELRRRRQYTKPSTARHHKSAAARQRRGGR